MCNDLCMQHGDEHYSSGLLLFWGLRYFACCLLYGDLRWSFASVVLQRWNVRWLLLYDWNEW